MVNEMAKSFHEIAKMNRVPKMTPAQVAEIFEKCVHADNDNLCADKDCTSCITDAARCAASILRKVASGELVPLPPPETSDYKGLKVKYRVFKASDNSAVEGCFVLRPEKDPAARAALFAYAFVTENRQLSEDILAWLLDMEKKGAPGE